PSPISFDIGLRSMSQVSQSLLTGPRAAGLTRRTLLAGATVAAGASAFCTCPCSAKASRVVESLGCVLTDSDAERLYPGAAGKRQSSTDEDSIIARSGDRDFDRALAQTLARISDVLQVSPGFAYYDDYDGLNAYATPKVRMNGPDGTVLFGQGFLKKLRAGREAPEVAVVAVCAHEFGHILQFKHRLTTTVRNGDSTVKRTELQADYFSGYFAGRRKKELPSYPAAVGALAQYNVGDHSLNSPQHHGTPDERGAAFVRGFEAAYHENRSLNDAVEQSIAYASRL
ncbi:MAG: hypothetical protein WCP68_10540, partial [Enhydrobacter sp.]